MKLIDSVITCAPYEEGLLWLKLKYETEVDQFILIENRYDYHGRDKGLWLKEALKKEQFKPYLDRIKVIELESKFSDPSEEHGIDPHNFARAEWELRDASMPYILENYSDNDRVFTSDVDELFDMQDRRRRDRIFKELAVGDAIQFDRVRYIYDIDNRAFRDVGDCINPCYTVGQLRTGVAKLRDKKWIGRLVGNEDNPVCFEYCHVFPKIEDYIAKHMSSLHTQWDEQKLRDAVEFNYWPATKYQNHPDKNNRWHWFKKVKLHKNNSPFNLCDVERRDWVPEDYIERRIKRFGFDGQFVESKDFLE